MPVPFSFLATRHNRAHCTIPTSPCIISVLYFSLSKHCVFVSHHRFNLQFSNGQCSFPDSSVGKETACNAEDPCWIPGSGRSTEEGLGYPLQYSWASLVAQLVKNLPANVEDLGSIPGLGRFPGEGKSYPL